MDKKKSFFKFITISTVCFAVLFLLPFLVLLALCLTTGNDPAKLGNALLQSIPWLVAYTAVVIISDVFLVLKFGKSIVAVAGKMEKGLQELEKGRLDIHIESTTSDEFGRAANAVNSFSDRLQTAIHMLIDCLDKLAAGDLSFSVDPSAWEGDWSRIGNALQALLDKQNEVLHNADNSANQTLSSSEQVASASQALAQGTTEQASAVEELSATISEISEHVKKDAADAMSADRASSRAGQKIEEADGSMQQMVKSMGEISDTSGKISNIIKTINDIAFQTNILALNAAVEAAHAGAAGKGFAVVADEVRNLASKSAEAAKDTTTLIEASIQAVDEGKKVAEVAEKTLQEVKSASLEANSLVNNIASASNEQAASIAQIAQGIQQISSVVQTNSATAQQSAAASEELAAQAKNLKLTLSTLKLSEKSESGFDAMQSRGPAKPPAPAATLKAARPKPSPVPAKAAFKSKTANDKYL